MESTPGVNWKFVVIATALVYLVSFVGGGIVGLFNVMSGGSLVGGTKIAVIAVSNFVVVLIGLVIVGSRTPLQRWQNITLVSAGLWLVSLSNILLGFVNFPQWLLSLVFYVLVGGVAGLLSMLVTGFIRASAKSTG
jgi:hypothetical protein